MRMSSGKNYYDEIMKRNDNQSSVSGDNKQMMASSVNKSGGDNSSTNIMSGRPPVAGLVERG
jgi:hypothetical protein